MEKLYLLGKDRWLDYLVNLMKDHGFFWSRGHELFLKELDQDKHKNNANSEYDRMVKIENQEGSDEDNSWARGWATEYNMHLFQEQLNCMTMVASYKFKDMPREEKYFSKTFANLKLTTSDELLEHLQNMK